VSPETPGDGTPQVDAARLIEQVRDYAIIALDGSGTIESWNRGAQNLKGYTAQEAIGRNFSMFYTDEDRRFGLPLELLDRARRDGRVEHLGWRVRKDGTKFWGDVIITAISDDFGSIVGFAKVTRDLTVQHHLEESLRRSEERFRLMVSQVRDYAIIALDPSGTIESWNAGAERVKGYTAEEAIGRSFSMFYTPEDRRLGLPFQLLDEARTQGSVEHTGWRVRKDGSKFWGDAIITAIHDDQGNLTGFAKVTRDLTERKELEDAQASFLASIAHDFRTPITAMKGFTELMRDAPPDMQEEFLARIDANADRLMQMMKDLVGYATLHSVSASYRPEMLDLSELVRATVRTMASTYDVGRVVLPELPCLVLADRMSMERIVTNLVSNALKYSESGPVAIDVTRADDRVRMSVTDEGRGIAAEDLDTIFEEFERGRLAQNDGGTGLGLTSVKRLVEEQGGRVDLASVVGQGTKVTVELPAPSQHRASA
jgi:PAS domain S-box-containing protein